ncbi:tRNA pseudouridine(55) synthase TruB [Candidatus Nomurabacteria bacterium]|nr:tRNA pseudouridine(55) synthase TruB [Candidatus Nomurabacteria bacterium]
MDSKDILLVDKPAGWTSFDVCAKIRGKIRRDYIEKGEKPTKRQLRVGHAGTLDPFATGLLIVLLGDECKKADDFLKQDKVYEATFTLGTTSTTGDPEGDLVAASEHQPGLDEIKSVLQQFTGKITQTPPAYSAVKVNGQRAYRLARDGKKVEIPSREVTVYSIDLVSYDYPNLKLVAHVSSGTYIRSLAEDIGSALGTGAYCSELRRTAIGKWSIDQVSTWLQ